MKIAKGNKDNLLFVNDNEYVRPNSANSVLKRIFKTKLGLSNENVSTHVLRHTYATLCMKSE